MHPLEKERESFVNQILQRDAERNVGGCSTNEQKVTSSV